MSPKSLELNWKDEFSRWYPEADVEVVTDWKYRRDAQVYIVNYEKFALRNANAEEFYKFCQKLGKYKDSMIVLDEAHRIKNRKAKSSTRLCSLRTKFDKALALTGTPAHNKVEDVWNVLHFVYPKEHTSYWKWLDEWCAFKNEYTPNGIVKVPNGIRKDKLSQFTSYINKHAIMRKRSEVMNWQTDVDVVDIRLPATPRQLRYIADLNKKFFTKDKETIVECKAVLDRLIRIRQICNAPELLKLSGTSPKVEWCKQYIKDFPEQSVLFFSNSKLTLRLLERELKAAIICGDTPAEERRTLTQQFQSGKIKVLLLQTQACKEGLTLDKADTTIFIDTYPPLADYLQAKDRMVASTAEMVKPRVVYRLMLAGTFDEVIYRLVDANKTTTDIVNNFKEVANGVS